MPPSSSAATPPAASGIGFWLAIVGGIILLSAIGTVVWRRRRRVVEAPREPAAVDPVVAVPARVPAPRAPGEVPATPVAPIASPAVTIELRPIRAGVNLLSATVESEVIVVNNGGRPIDEVRVEIAMIGAHARQDADLAAIAAAPVTRPVIAPFTLQPGDTVRLSAVAALPRASINPLDAGGRPIFVPIVAIKLAGTVGDAPLRRNAAFAVGVERVDSARLAPFRLDGPPRTFDTVAARPHPIG